MALEKYFDKMANDMRDLASDASKMLSEKQKEGDSGTEKKPSKDKKLKSFQKLTTFYSSKEEAQKEQDKDPMIAFIDKRIKDIFRG